MSRRLLCTLTLLSFHALCLFGDDYQQNGKRDLPFMGGESLTYVLSYTWGGINTEVGEGVATLIHNDSVFNAIVKGKTYKFYDIFFKVREHFESRFSDSTLSPISFYRNTLEGKYRMVNNFRFDHAKDKLYITTRKRDDPPKDTSFTGISNIYDLVTLFYKCRTVDFSKIRKNEKQPITFAIDREVYNLYFIYKGNEIKKVKGLGTFKAMKFAVSLVAGEIFTGEDELSVWITDDKNKIPILFESKVLVGTVTGYLKKYENLRHPVTSKIK